MAGTRDIFLEIANSIKYLSKRVRKLETQVIRSSSTVINVKDYGARGDGVTDDTVAIQAALDVGYTYFQDIVIYFPRGTYLVTSSLNLTDRRDAIIYGDGGGYSGYATSKILSRANGKPAIDMSGSGNITVRDITIHGDSTSSPSCGILLARSTAINGENSAFNYFERVCLTGYYTVSSLYSWASEVNSYIKCLFENLSTSGKCAVFLGSRNRYSITSDYVSFSSTITGAVANFLDCSIAFYGATSPDAIVVIGDTIGSARFEGGYAQSNLACPSVEAEGTLYEIKFRSWYIEHANVTTVFLFTLYSGAGSVYGFEINGGVGGQIASDYFIDQPASHTINYLHIENVRARLAATSAMRFQGIVDQSIIHRWWLFDNGTLSFNILANSEVWYQDHALSVTTLYNTNFIRKDVNFPYSWFGSQSLQIGTNAQRIANELATVSRILTYTATWNPGSLNDGESETTFVLFSDASIISLDQCVCLATFDQITTTGWIISAYLAPGPAVVVTIINKTGGVVNLPSGTLRVVLLKVA